MNRYIFRYTSGGFQYEHNRKPLKIAVLWQQTRNPSDSALRVFGEIRKPFFHAKTAEYQRFQDIRHKQRMYGNVRQCQHFRYPARVPELSTQQDMLTTALQIRHSVRASHEQGSSAFLIITPVHAHRHVQRLRRHIRRNPRRNAPIRRNIQPRTLQTTPSLTNRAARHRTGSLML